MIDHVSTYATDYLRTRAFYAATLPLLGYTLQREVEISGSGGRPGFRMGAFGPADRPIFWIIETVEPATPRHVAFSALGRQSVDAWHAAAIQAGARDNGPPGLRPQYHPQYYGAFVLDPDGNNVEACCHLPG